MSDLATDLAAIRAWCKKEPSDKERADWIADAIEDREVLLARLEEMREVLERLNGWIEHGLPEVPHEGSHTPESGCDINCMNEAQLSKDMGLVTSALRPLGEPG